VFILGQSRSYLAKKTTLGGFAALLGIPKSSHKTLLL
jgi:hypothetical protein